MISVCLATYNGAQYIGKQIDSILSQLSSDDEIIISDDGSTDGTLDIINNYHSSQIHLYHHKNEHGYTSNFEYALQHASGDVIFLSDQDDIWLPNKVRHCLDLLLEYDFVVSDARVINSDGNDLASSFYAIRGPKRTFTGNLIKFGYLGCCYVFRHDILKKALPFPSNRIYCTHDNWLMLVALAFYKVKIIDEALILYRRHELNVSTGAITGNKSSLFRIKYRIYLFFHIVKRFLHI